MLTLVFNNPRKLICYTTNKQTFPRFSTMFIFHFFFFKHSVCLSLINISSFVGFFFFFFCFLPWFYLYSFLSFSCCSFFLHDILLFLFLSFLFLCIILILILSFFHTLPLSFIQLFHIKVYFHCLLTLLIFSFFFLTFFFISTFIFDYFLL